jgi:hypothetical protein
MYIGVKTLIDIGGKDAKNIFFKHEGMPNIRMNSSCAGGLIHIRQTVETNLARRDMLWLLSFLGKKISRGYLDEVRV